MALATVFWPPTTTGPGETMLQFVETAFVTDCRLNPVTLVGHVKMTLVPDCRMLNFGGLMVAGPIARLKTVPEPVKLSGLPPPVAVPYSALPEKISPAFGCAPSMLV